jgi:hypothetical protein
MFSKVTKFLGQNFMKLLVDAQVMTDLFSAYIYLWLFAVSLADLPRHQPCYSKHTSSELTAAVVFFCIIIVFGNSK